MNATSDNPTDEGPWLVLVNAEGQHSLWQASRPVPAGWQEVGPEGSREDCLAWIDEQWTDMRPSSLH